MNSSRTCSGIELRLRVYNVKQTPELGESFSGIHHHRESPIARATGGPSPVYLPEPNPKGIPYPLEGVVLCNEEHFGVYLQNSTNTPGEGQKPRSAKYQLQAPGLDTHPEDRTAPRSSGASRSAVGSAQELSKPSLSLSGGVCAGVSLGGSSYLPGIQGSLTGSQMLPGI